MKRWLKTSWGISIGTAIFSFLLTVGYDIVKDKPVFSTIWMVMRAIVNFVFAILNFRLQVWWILIGIAGIIVILFVIAKILDKKEATKPEFHSYTEDYFRHWRWSWNWAWSGSKCKWHVIDLSAHCPKCDTAMTDHSSYISGILFTCPRCGFQARDHECDQAYEVESVIIDNLNRKRKKDVRQ